ncbi:495_t:CDS:1, partial [Funneliformis mosseae]
KLLQQVMAYSSLEKLLHPCERPLNDFQLYRKENLRNYIILVKKRIPNGLANEDSFSFFHKERCI